jgi:hypothetical protein
MPGDYEIKKTYLTVGKVLGKTQTALSHQSRPELALLWQIFVGSIVFGIPEFRVA